MQERKYETIVSLKLFLDSIKMESSLTKMKSRFIFSKQRKKKKLFYCVITDCQTTETQLETFVLQLLQNLPDSCLHFLNRFDALSFSKKQTKNFNP